MISGKYKVVILWHLGIEGPYRFNGLQKLFDGVSHKTLSNQLKELVEDGMISRKMYPESGVFYDGIRLFTITYY